MTFKFPNRKLRTRPKTAKLITSKKYGHEDQFHLKASLDMNTREEYDQQNDIFIEELDDPNTKDENEDVTVE